MSDYSELKRLADAANAVTGDVSVDIAVSSERGPNQSEIDAVTAFVGAATPAAVLALIAENERLSTACTRAEQVINAESKAASISTGRANLLQAERDLLKAESEALRKDAERYRLIRDRHQAGDVRLAVEMRNMKTEMSVILDGPHSDWLIDSQIKEAFKP